MPFSISDIVWGAITPMIVSAIVLMVMQRRGNELTDRYGSSLAMASGFVAGYGLLSLAPWTPEAHWHWLPYAMIVAAGVGPLCGAAGVKPIERWVTYALVATGIGYLLVPSWEDLDPTRSVYLIGFVIYVSLLTPLIESITHRLRGPIIPAAMGASITAASIVLALSSLRLAQIGISGAGSMFGILLVAMVVGEVASLPSIALLYGVTIVGALMIGQVNAFNDLPWIAYLAIPIAPLAVGLTAAGPLSRRSPTTRTIAGGLLVAIPLAIAVGSAIVADLRHGSEY